jgi:iron complex outermembrane receptor protein
MIKADRTRRCIALSVAVGAPLALTLPTGTVLGQSLIEEVTVTAQRREEAAQDIPIAVTAFDDEQLQRLNITETLDLTKLVPNFIGHNNTGLGTANTYSLRGLNNTESIATFDPPVGSYVDDIYVTRQNANNFTLFDVERIEVLRGPQGTLFGRNTTGGAVRVILKKPAEQLGGYIQGGYGEFDRFDIRGSVDIPITDRVLTKVSAYWIEDDGFVDNKTTGEDDVNREENYGIRGHALFRITDAVTWDIALDYIDDDHANMLNFKDGSSRITNTGLTKSGQPLAGILTGEKQNFALGNEVESFNVTSVLDWQVGDLGTLSFITGWRDLDQDFNLDFFDGSASYGGFTIGNQGEHEQFTQEIKWAGQIGDVIDYIGGIFYIDEDNTTDFGDIFDLGFPLVLADRVLENTTEAWAAYIQGDYHINQQWTVTVGVRYTDEDKDVAFSDNIPSGDATDLTTANVIATGTPVEQSEELWTPRFALEWKPADNQLYYASATRGFKSGGWNARGTSPEQLQPFDSEIVWSYEVGMKTDWLDNRFRFNLTGFYSDVSDFQLPSAFTTATGGIVFITRNFADLEVLGLEAEIIVAPTDNFNAFANIGILDAEYKSLDQSIIEQREECQTSGTRCGEGIVDLDGNIADPVRSPDYTVNVGFNYVWPIAGSYELIPSAFLYTVGDHNVATSGLPPGLNDGYTTWNGSLTLQNVDQDWSLAVECKNCNDRTMVVSVLAGFQYLQDPRTWMIKFRKNFGQD